MPPKLEMQQLEFYPAFLMHPGEPAIPWDRWNSLYKNYLVASGLENLSDKRKKALLLHNLGVEGQRIFQTLPDSTTCDFDEAINLLEVRF